MNGDLGLTLYNMGWEETKTMRTEWLPNIQNKITHLRIEKGNLRHLKIGIFRKEMSINFKVVELIDLPINDLPTFFFVFTVNLKSLYIRNLAITYIQLQSMPSLINLEIIGCATSHDFDISRFLMHRVKCHKLITLRFNHNNIQNSIKENTFSMLCNIGTLDLSHNEIENFPENAFNKLSSNIETLNLAHNKLKTLPEMFFNIFHRLEKDHVIHLSDNLFECGCDVKNVKEYITQYPNKFATFPYCSKKIDAWHVNFSIEQIEHICSVPRVIEINDFDDNDNCSSMPITEVTLSNISTTAAGHELVQNIGVNCYSHYNIVVPQILSSTNLQRKIRIASESNDKYLITTKYPLDYSILYLENNFLIDGYKNLPRLKCLLNTKTNQIGYLKAKLSLKPNHLYQFCMMKNELLAASSLECISFYTHFKIKINAICWILIKYRTVVVTAWIFVGIIAFILGIYLSFSVAKRFPKLLGLKTKKPVFINRNKTPNFMRHNEMYVENI